MKITKFILQIARPFKWKIILFVFPSAVWAIELSLRPYLIKCALDTITSTSKAPEDTMFFTYIAYYFALMLSVFTVNIIYEYNWINFLPNIRTNIGNKLFGVLLNHPYAFYQNHFAGSLASKLNNCIGSIPRIIRALNEDFFRHILAVIISFYALWQVDFKFSVGLMVWAIFYLLSSIFFAPLIKKKSIAVAQESSKGLGYIIDILSNILSVKLFNYEEKEKQLVNSNFESWKTLIHGRDLILVHLFTFQTVSFVIFQALCLYWLKTRAGSDIAKAGDFVLIFSVSFSVYSCLQGITRTIADFIGDLGTVSEAISVFYNGLEPIDHPHAAPIKISGGVITFSKVKFQYQDATSLFQNKSITIKGGQKVGLVGYSGSGKSTFVSLIFRLYNIMDGKILIDGQDITDVTQESLCSSIGMIPQDAVLFHRSLMENIRYGRVDATDEEVIEAAKKAYAHDFIMHVPGGYDTLVGERGVKLSGGQRQRIAIARAILKNAPILMLDEATSQLDSVTEAEIQESLWHLMQDKTTIVIAHRLSTLLHMDRIIVFDKGKIVEDGTHMELLHKGGLYKTLWDAQVGGFLPDKKNDSEL